MDFDTGAMVSGAGADVFWEQFASVKRGMVPQNRAKSITIVLPPIPPRP